MDDGGRVPEPVVVVAMPQEIDASSSPQIGRQLSLALLAGVTTLIIDFSATTFCGPTGVGEVVLAHRLAAKMNAELRLVVPSPAVLRILSLTGVDQLAPVYHSLGAAQEAAADAATDAAPGEKEVPGAQKVTW
jgi:anti-sigma B factor antagonist